MGFRWDRRKDLLIRSSNYEAELGWKKSLSLRIATCCYSPSNILMSTVELGWGGCRIEEEQLRYKASSRRWYL